MKSNGQYRWVAHWAAVLTAALTLPLLYVGGSVTTYRVGLAVPDWPTTFGENMFLYNFWEAPFGVKLEHAHRLYGAAIGFATIAVTASFLLFDPRRWAKGLAVFALAAVIAQGILGGSRVTQISTFFAAVHGATGQAFFGLMVALAVISGRDWNQNATRLADPAHLRRRATVVLALVYVQIALGSWLRHYGTPLAFWAHALFATSVWGHAAALSWRTERHRGEAPFLLGPSRLMGVTVTVQILLGLAALAFVLPFGGVPRPATFYPAIVRTAHQTNAAILFAAAIVLTLRAYRHLDLVRPAVAGADGAPATGRLEQDQDPAPAPGPDQDREQAARDWEAVA